MVQPSERYWGAGEKKRKAALSGRASRACTRVCDAAREIVWHMAATLISGIADHQWCGLKVDKNCKKFCLDILQCADWYHWVLSSCNGAEVLTSFLPWPLQFWLSVSVQQCPPEWRCRWRVFRFWDAAWVRCTRRLVTAEHHHSRISSQRFGERDILCMPQKFSAASARSLTRFWMLNSLTLILYTWQYLASSSAIPLPWLVLRSSYHHSCLRKGIGLQNSKGSAGQTFSFQRWYHLYCGVNGCTEIHIRIPFHI